MRGLIEILESLKHVTRAGNLTKPNYLFTLLRTISVSGAGASEDFLMLRMQSAPPAGNPFQFVAAQLPNQELGFCLWAD